MGRSRRRKKKTKKWKGRKRKKNKVRRRRKKNGRRRRNYVEYETVVLKSRAAGVGRAADLFLAVLEDCVSSWLVPVDFGIRMWSGHVTRQAGGETFSVDRGPY
jgi:hypothetical protein